MITVQDVLQQGTRLLKKHSDSQTPYLDALLLMGDALKKSKEQVLASLQDSIWEVDALAFGKSIELRMKGRPVAYMLRKKEFYGLEFYVDSRVLIPRPDTELLVELTLETAKASTKDPYTILDLGTGSGCIGIAVYHALTAADENRTWEVTLSDISKEALSVCSVNSRSITGRELPAVRSNLFETIDGSFDLIITNPPYLTDQECSSPQVKARREPDSALRSGPDGLKHIREITQQAPAHLSAGGKLIIEGGYDQAESIEQLMKEAGYRQITIHQDLAGRNRAVEGNV